EVITTLDFCLCSSTIKNLWDCQGGIGCLWSRVEGESDRFVLGSRGRGESDRDDE
ncbi:hypothetical protein Tco_1047049, partial [Tanacetum coccineum]